MKHCKSYFQIFARAEKCTKIMEHSLDQQCMIKFRFHLGKTISKMLVLIKEAHKGNTLSKAQVFRWFNEFKNRQMIAEDME